MKLSFVIPAYNEEAAVTGCLTSISREIARAKCDAEIILVNNGSTDRTKEVASSVPGVRVVDEPRKGTNRARQAGLEASTGELVANIDADSIVPEEWIDVVFAEFARNKNLVGLSGPYIHYDLKGFTYAMGAFFQFTVFLAYLVNRFVLRVNSQLLGGNCVMRRDALLKAGGYNTALTFYGDDIDTAKRLFAIGDVKFTYNLRMYSSGRRLVQHGILKTTFLYVLNFFSGMYANKTITKTHADARMPADTTAGH